MPFTSIEIKARCTKPHRTQIILEQHQADFKGIDHQIDTYFNVPNGRMKLREGNIEKFLIHYNRPNQAGPKTSKVILYQPHPDSTLKLLLTTALGVWKVVDKKRAIYFIDNVKFHIDEVVGLGSFVEIEALDRTGEMTAEKLQKQCAFYLELLGIKDDDLITHSYSDLVTS